MDGIELGREVGARVGEEVSDSEDGGNRDGSKSRSGIGGESSGRRVMRNNSRRSTALKKRMLVMTRSRG